MSEKPKTDAVGNSNNSIEKIISIDNGVTVRSLLNIDDVDDFLFIVCLLFGIIIVNCICDGWVYFGVGNEK